MDDAAAHPAAVDDRGVLHRPRRRRWISLYRLLGQRTALPEAVRQPRGNAMSRTLFASALAALALFWGAGLASAQQSGTAAEAKAMLDRAVAVLKTEFKATALSEFNDKS